MEEKVIRFFYLAYDPEAQQKWAVLEGVYRKAGSMTIQFPWSGPWRVNSIISYPFIPREKGRLSFRIRFVWGESKVQI
ncbi:hypothetical protein [Algoriphagus boritolerans]|uniref:hypothetical protein n=1 Tax=Algoriphagus boritolerans TaxID=308111 RepID=UPI000AE51372